MGDGEVRDPSMVKTRRFDRRGFLKGAAIGAAAGGAALVEQIQVAAVAAQPAATPQRGTAAPPSAAQLAAETEPVSPDVTGLTADDPGSDFMVDVIKSLDFEYVA